LAGENLSADQERRLGVRPVKITELDHIVLNVRDIDQSLAFYTQVLGLQGERVEEFKGEKTGFPSVRINEHAIIDLSPLKENSSERQQERKKGHQNLNHFCLVAEKADLAEIIEYLKNHKVPILRGPVSRWGARGRATSVYLLDPDGNEIEIRCY
jgi:catechol 2,3-dioxygenase-like lactoylglutathione lyase family enzyme